MSDEGFFVGTVCLLVIIVIAGLWGSQIGCHWRWDGSGRQVKWGVVSGCLVHDGKGWVPA